MSERDLPLLQNLVAYNSPIFLMIVVASWRYLELVKLK